MAYIQTDETGDTQIPLGACGKMKNIYINKSMKPKKADGYRQLFNAINKPIRGMWYGRVGLYKYLLFACNGKVYLYNNDGTYLNIASVTDAPTEFFGFGGNVYIVNGHEYKKWTGSGSATDVTGYVPKVYVSVLPSGVKVDESQYENLNLLTGKKHMTFNGDGTSTVYQLAEIGIDSVDKVVVDGVIKTETTHYTVDKVNGKVTFTSGNIPISAEDNVDIYWTKGTGSRSEILNNLYARTYGETNDTRVFLFGNSSAKNRIVYSGLADGVPSAEYFPANNYMDVGVANIAIMDFIRHQTRFVVYKEDGVYIGNYETMTDSTGKMLVTFPTSPLTNITTKPYAQVRMCNGYPISVGESIRKLISTEIQNERDTPIISSRIQPDLDKVDLSKAITVDFENRWEYWIAVDKTVWIYNYILDTYSKLELAHMPTYFIVIDGVLHMGTNEGYVMKFGEQYEDFNGIPIEWKFEMNFYDFGASYIKKTLKSLHASIQPTMRSGFKISVATNEGLQPNYETKQYIIHNFVKQDFSLMGYNTSLKPQPFRVRLKPKKFEHLKIIFESLDTLDDFTLLEYDMSVEYGGMTK